MDDALPFWQPIDPDDYDQSWTPRPPATLDEVRAWEAEHSVRLPPRLSTALMVQNGGWVRGTDSLYLSSLSGIKSLVGEECDHYFHEEGNKETEVTGRDKLFVFGIEHDCNLVLDYRRNQDPEILWIDHNVGGRVSPTGMSSFDNLIKGRGEEAPGP